MDIWQLLLLVVIIIMFKIEKKYKEEDRCAEIIRKMDERMAGYGKD